MKRLADIRAEAIPNSLIVSTAEQITLRYIENLGRVPVAKIQLSFDKIYEDIIYPEFGISLEEGVDLGFDEANNKILGKYDALENAALIDACISKESNDPRRTFTLWHEVGGHGVLQGAWLKSESKRLQRDFSITTTESSLSFEAVDVLERQANLFAANAAAPKQFLLPAIDAVLRLTRPIRYVGPSRYTLDIHGHTRSYWVDSLNELSRVIASHVKWQFDGLSVEALSYQIERLSVFDDITKARFGLHRVDRVPKYAHLLPTFSPSIVASNSERR